MLLQPDDVVQFLEVPNSKSISKIEIHLGLCLGESPAINMTEQWLQCIEKVASEFKPSILHIHHNVEDVGLSNEVVNTLHERHFLIHQREDQWIMWLRYVLKYPKASNSQISVI